MAEFFPLLIIWTVKKFYLNGFYFIAVHNTPQLLLGKRVESIFILLCKVAWWDVKFSDPSKQTSPIFSSKFIFLCSLCFESLSSRIVVSHLLLPQILDLREDLMSRRNFPLPYFILTTACILHFEETSVFFYFLVFSFSYKNIQQSPHSSSPWEVQGVFWGVVAVWLDSYLGKVLSSRGKKKEDSKKWFLKNLVSGVLK